jgi:hypothetical protein
VTHEPGHGLGRVFIPDDRDRSFPMRAVLPDESRRTWRNWWPGGLWADQGSTSSCVGHAWAHWVEDGPVSHRGSVDPMRIYHEAQKVDEWPGEGYDGTSVRAGAKVLQSDGLIAGYRWATTVDDVELAILEAGPVVVGTNWYTGMFRPDAKGYVHATGQVEGGHAYLVNGYSRIAERFRCKNSWGRSWGRRGHFYVGRDVLAQLLSERGEACLAVEVAS